MTKAPNMMKAHPVTTAWLVFMAALTVFMLVMDLW